MKQPHGVFSWADLWAPDRSAAQKFYTALFGWEAEELPAGGGVTYTMFRKDGKQVAGVGDQPPEQQQAGIPPMWSAYVNVDDVDKIAAHATELGATVVIPPDDVLDSGRLTYLMDPTGAGIGFWQPKANRAGAAFDVPGSMTWTELTTRDTSKAKDFYTTLLPWEADEQDYDGLKYTTFRLGDRSVGGMYAMDENWPSEVPAHWLIYFAVEDCDASTKQVEELGGGVSTPPSDSPYGRFSMVSDPHGARFAVIKLPAQS